MMKEIIELLYWNYMGMFAPAMIFVGVITWIPAMIINEVLIDEES